MCFCYFILPEESVFHEFSYSRSQTKHIVFLTVQICIDKVYLHCKLQAVSQSIPNIFLNFYYLSVNYIFYFFTLHQAFNTNWSKFIHIITWLEHSEHVHFHKKHLFTSLCPLPLSSTLCLPVFSALWHRPAKQGCGVCEQPGRCGEWWRMQREAKARNAAELWHGNLCTELVQLPLEPTGNPDVFVRLCAGREKNMTKWEGWGWGEGWWD